MPNQTVQIRWWAVRGFQRDYLRRLIRWQGLNFVLTPDSTIYAVQQTIIWCSETGSLSYRRFSDLVWIWTMPLLRRFEMRRFGCVVCSGTQMTGLLLIFRHRS